MLLISINRPLTKFTQWVISITSILISVSGLLVKLQGLCNSASTYPSPNRAFCPKSLPQEILFSTIPSESASYFPYSSVMPFLCVPSAPSAQQLGGRRGRRVTSFSVSPLYTRACERRVMGTGVPMSCGCFYMREFFNTNGSRMTILYEWAINGNWCYSFPSWLFKIRINFVFCSRCSEKSCEKRKEFREIVVPLQNYNMAQSRLFCQITPTYNLFWYFCQECQKMVKHITPFVGWQL